MKTPKIKFADTYELENGLTLIVKTEHDPDASAPWEECDGHGPVTEWTRREKKPGEFLLCSDRSAKRFYDFAQAVETAKSEGWSCSEVLPTDTKGQKAHKAVMADYEYLRAWCENRWEYLIVTVSIIDQEGEEIASDSLGWVESYRDHWLEIAQSMADDLIARYTDEQNERAYWEERDMATV